MKSCGSDYLESVCYHGHYKPAKTTVLLRSRPEWRFARNATGAGSEVACREGAAVYRLRAKKDGCFRMLGHYAPLLFSLHVNLCSLYFFLFISMLAVANDKNSAKIKNLES